MSWKTFKLAWSIPVLLSVSSAAYGLIVSGPKSVPDSLLVEAAATVGDFRFVNESTAIGLDRVQALDVSVSHGKWYWEVHSPNVGHDGGKLADTLSVGVARPNYPSDAALGVAKGSWGWRGDGFRLADGNAPAKYGTKMSQDLDAIMVALDAKAGLLWIGLNGKWFGGGNPAKGTGATFTGIAVPVRPSVSSKHTGLGQAVMEVSITQKSWKYAPPRGYRSLTQYSPAGK